MMNGIYRNLSIQGIIKNKKIYYPYIFSSIGVIMMTYIVAYLAKSQYISSMSGGAIVSSYLFFGTIVMAVFSFIFLVYTNSFLMKQRKKELGLYNVLGLGKRNIAIVQLFETIIIFAVSILGGIFLGILFSKFAELLLFKIVHSEISFSFSINFEAILLTFEIFAVIFFVILVKNIFIIYKTNVTDLLKSENSGEKPPKANFLLAITGIIILAFAYYIAVSIESPIDAMVWFFIAVIMVIIATYMIFISTSVAFCRILQKNKNYYYKTNHFISISSMSYRMRRNGGGLATICILSTMLLVTMSTTFCLYSGLNEIIRERYPRNINLDIVFSNSSAYGKDSLNNIDTYCKESAEAFGANIENIIKYENIQFDGPLTEKSIYTGSNKNFDSEIIEPDVLYYFFSIDYYNETMGEDEVLQNDEAIIYTTKNLKYNNDTISIDNNIKFKVKKHVDKFENYFEETMTIFPAIYIFVDDLDIVEEYAETVIDENVNSEFYQPDPFHYNYSFDLDVPYETQMKISENISENKIDNYRNDIIAETSNEEIVKRIEIETVASGIYDVYSLYGGLFFLGTLLGIVFLFATVLIMYYKQISEGYEDVDRFKIMQKVGLNKKDIKKSVSSQMLTVFFLPVITAIVHLCFAFQIIKKIMLLFMMKDVKLMAIVSIICCLIFVLFYIVVYKITSNSYYSIITSTED